jgi:hypothetical protein
MNQTIFSDEKTDQWDCPCGCARSFPRVTALLHHGATGMVAMRAHLLEMTEGDPHLWLLLGTGSSLALESSGSWVTVHAWVNNGELIARIEDPESSPFVDADVFDERRLGRDEVFQQDGGAQWVFECHDFIVDHHPAIRQFLQGAAG